MDHVASVPSATSGRMAPEAVGLAVVLHLAAAVALWWLAAHAPTIVPKEDPIEVTIERAKPPQPPPPPPPQAQPKPTPPPPPEGLKPPAELEADKATSVRPSGEAPKDVAAPPQRSLEEAVPKPADAPKPPSETAMVAPSPPSPVPPPDRPTLQPFPKPDPGPTVEPVPPRPRPPIEKPPPAMAHPQPQPQPQRAPPPPAMTQQPHPSPLASPHSPSQPPAVARHQDIPTPPSSPFVNPMDERARATAEQNYLWQVVSRLRGYRYHADVGSRVEGLTVVMVVIARDGRLLDVQVVSSSGVAAMDQGVLNGVRQGSPYTPLPPSISGPSARFRLPLVSVREDY
jgi:TonB family protein